MKTLYIHPEPVFTFSTFTELFRHTADIMSLLHYKTNDSHAHHKNLLLSALQKADKTLKAYFLLLQKMPGKRKISQEDVINNFEEAATAWNNLPAKIKEDITSIYSPETFVESAKKLLANADQIKKIAKDSPIRLHEITEED